MPDEQDPLVQPEPLTDRLEREAKGRGTRQVVLTVVVVAMAVVFLAASLRGLFLAVFRFGSAGSPGISEALFGFAVSLLPAGVAYLMIRRPNAPNTLVMLSAVPAKPGDLRDTRDALHDMCLASGLSPTPALYVIETPAVNALVIGRESSSPRVVVTRGLAGLLTRDEQRAVMAHLLARMRIGLAPSAEGAGSYEEQADALGMQTLRDPRSMLSALERTRGVPSVVRVYGYGVFDGYAFLPVFPWDAAAAAHDRRMARLRAVLGAEGAASTPGHG